MLSEREILQRKSSVSGNYQVNIGGGGTPSALLAAAGGNVTGHASSIAFNKSEEDDSVSRRLFMGADTMMNPFTYFSHQPNMMNSGGASTSAIQHLDVENIVSPLNKLGIE